MFKKVVLGCSKCEITWRFSETLEITYEGVQFSEVTGLQPENKLLKIDLLQTDFFIDIKQRFHKTKISAAYSQIFAAFFQFI